MNWNIGWGLTKTCNSKCLHCYNESGKKSNTEITFEQAKRIVDKLSQNKVQTINYGTGESGLIDYFWDLVRYVYEKKIIQGLTTNGSSINKNTISFVKQYLNDVDVSLDYPSKEENNKFRGTDSAWDWAVNAAELLKKNNINFSIVTCLHALNSSKEHIIELLKFCKKYNCDWRVNWFRPTGRGKSNKILKLDPVQVHHIFKTIVENSIIKALPDPYFSALLGLNRRVGCPCGRESFRITPDTEVVPCVYFTKELKNISILDSNFEEVVNSPPMQNIINRKLDFCKSCEYFYHCRGGCASRAFLEYDTMDAPDAFCYKKLNFKDNPFKSLKYLYDPSSLKVHENYLCTLIVRAK